MFSMNISWISWNTMKKLRLIHGLNEVWWIKYFMFSKELNTSWMSWIRWKSSFSCFPWRWILYEFVVSMKYDKKRVIHGFHEVWWIKYFMFSKELNTSWISMKMNTSWIYMKINASWISLNDGKTSNSWFPWILHVFREVVVKTLYVFDEYLMESMRCIGKFEYFIISVKYQIRRIKKLVKICLHSG